MALLADPFDETRLDRQLGRRQRERFFRELDGNAVYLEQNPARLDPDHPQFRRALARAHADFERLLRHRHVREDADPDPAGALHVARQRTARGLDLARGDPLRLHGLEAELAERKVDAGRGDALDAPFMRLAELGADWLQHDSMLSCSFFRYAASRRGRPASPSAIFLSCAIGSCSMISPLKIQTFTPQVP